MMDIQLHICPKCKKAFTEGPALSRDGKSGLCYGCSMDEVYQVLEKFICWDRTGDKKDNPRGRGVKRVTW